MRGKVFIVSLFLMSLLMLLVGCGKKGPPSVPQKPSSLIKIEQNAQLPRYHNLDLGIVDRPGVTYLKHTGVSVLF